MKISQREMVLGVATLACLLIGGTWYGVNGKVAEWKDKKGEIARLRDQIIRHEAAINMQSEWSEELAGLEERLRVFDTEQRSVSPELMRTINQIADNHELDILRSNPFDEKPTGNLFELGINCTWNGDLTALVGFLTELQQQGIRYDIRSLNIQPAGKNSGSLKGNMVINCAYTRRPGAKSESE